MIIKEIGTREVDGWIELSGLIVSEKRWSRHQRIWWRLPNEYASVVRVSGDPFLAALLPLAMLKRERLRIEAGVSPVLLRSVDKIQAIYHEWLPKTELISVEAPTLVDILGDKAVGCFFSGGVDSFYTLLKNDQLPVDDPNRLTHLVFVGGFDLPLTENALFRQVRAGIQRVAASSGRHYLEIKTNLRSIADPILSWGFYHGAALASAGLACGSLFVKLLIPSSFAHEQLHPWGSHPRLDPLWSTGNTEFVHDGCEALRSEKIVDWICRSELAMQNLRVCWKNYHRRYNCSICEKCVRTMFSLHIGTGSFSFPTFEKPLTPEGIRRLNLKNETQFAFARENEHLIQTRPCDLELSKAMSEIIYRGQAKPSDPNEGDD